MPDRKPPRTAGDERSTLAALLRFQRESFVRKVEGTDDHDATTPLVGSGTTLLWLSNHVADAEASWLLRRFAQVPDGDARYPGEHARSIDEAVARYRRTWDAVDEVVAGASLDDVCSFDDGPTVNLRWVLGHLLEEVARHAGHADILREIIDGTTGR